MYSTTGSIKFHTLLHRCENIDNNSTGSHRGSSSKIKKTFALIVAITFVSGCLNFGAEVESSHIILRFEAEGASF